MSDEATLKFAHSYPGDAAPADMTAPHALVARAAYDAVATDGVTIPDTTDDGQTMAVDLGDITGEITAFVLTNRTGQELKVSLNGDTNTWKMPSGATLAYATPTSSSAVIESIEVITTATQVGDGHVDAVVFGAIET